MAETQVPSPHSKVDEYAFIIILWLFFALAVVPLSIRTTVRYRMHKRLQPDDYLLIFAAACLTAATIFMQIRYHDMYRIANFTFNPFGPGAPKNADQLKYMINRQFAVLWIYIPLTWTTIFAAKFAYLGFFRKLVDRIRPLLLYWWAVCGMCVAGYIFCLVQVFAVCPFMDLRAVQCSSGTRFAMATRFSRATAAFDIVTDLLIVSISIALLWKVKIRASQKLGLAFFLCLSVVLAAICVVRVSGLRVRTAFGTWTFDGPWVYLWQQIEASLAVCLVSSTAFRSLFVQQEARKRQLNARPQWYSSAIERLKRSRSGDVEAGQKLPAIPSGTLTGLLSFFGGSRSRAAGSMDSMSSMVSDAQTVYEKHGDDQIVVTKTFHTKVEEYPHGAARQPAVPNPHRYQEPSPNYSFTSRTATSSASTMLPQYRQNDTSPYSSQV